MTTKKKPEQKPESTRVLEPCGETGVSLTSNCRLKQMKVYQERGAIHFWVIVDNGKEEIEALQYLTLHEAVAFSKALELCAIEALKVQGTRAFTRGIEK